MPGGQSGSGMAALRRASSSAHSALRSCIDTHTHARTHIHTHTYAEVIHEP
jgi:hypothetical protein